MVHPMITTPHEEIILEANTVEQHQHHFNGDGRLVRAMAPESMRSGGYSQATAHIPDNEHQPRLPFRFLGSEYSVNAPQMDDCHDVNVHPNQRSFKLVPTKRRLLIFTRIDFSVLSILLERFDIVYSLHNFCVDSHSR